MADNFGLKIGVEGEKEFKKALSEINQSFKVLGSEMNLVASQFDKQDKSVQALAARNGVLNKEIDTQRQKIGTLEQALQNATASFGENDRRTKQWQTQLNNAKATLNEMEKELADNNRALEETGDALDEAGEQADEFGNSLSESASKADDAGGRFQKLGGVAKTIGAVVAAAVVSIGAAAVAAGVGLVKLGDEYNQAVGQISASTGATGAELEALGDTARKVYTNNFGDSLQDVADGIATVQKTTGLMDAELQKATESGFALRDTFGYEMQESARAANALMKNFGISAEEAYNIIAVGAQNGADQNGDLLDTLNEYSAQYSALGLSAEEFVSGLVSGSEAGVFSIDKVGDAVKEFNLRVKDGSKTTTEAFQALGMDADDMAARFAAGGDSAREAFFEVVGALDGMDDPIAKNTAAVNLFGTQFEDLQANVLPVLASMEDGAGKTYDALSQINQIKYDNLDSAIEGTKRSIQGVFLPLASEMSAGITDVFSTLGNEINAANGNFEQIGLAIGTAMEGITAIILEKMPVFLELGLTIITSIGNAILANLPMLIESATNIILTLLNALISALPMLTEGALQLVLALVQGILDNLPQILEAAIQVVVTLALGIAEALPQLIPSIIEAILLICSTLLDNMDQILEAAFAIIEGLAQGLLNALPKLIAALPKIITSIVNFITQNLPKIIEMGIKLVVQLAVGLVKAIPQLVAALPQIIGAILKGLGQAVVSVVEIGKNIVQGLWQGITSLASWIWDKVSGWISGIWDGICSFFGINSPSKEMAWVGEMLVKGLAGSIQSNGKQAVSAAEKMSSDIDGVMNKLAGDMQTAIPTDFNVNARANVDGGMVTGAALGGMAGGGPLVTVQQMIVRSEDDIRKISQELYNLMQVGSRAQGRIITA